MKQPVTPVKRGRPCTITRERIANAGIEIGLPNITFVGVSVALGVSHMALYKHVQKLKELKRLVAEEAFKRWQIPMPSDHSRDGLRTYMIDFSLSMRKFVKAHPGVTPYVISRWAATPAMLTKIKEHQIHIAKVYGITNEQSRWLLATVAFHSLAASEAVYSVAGREPDLVAQRTLEEVEMEAELDQGLRALIVGALAMLEEVSNKNDYLL